MSMENITTNALTGVNAGYKFAEDTLSDKNIANKITAGALLGYNAGQKLADGITNKITAGAILGHDIAQGIAGKDSIMDKVKTGVAMPLVMQGSIFGKAVSDDIETKEVSKEDSTNQESVTKKDIFHKAKPNIFFSEFFKKLLNSKKEVPTEDEKPKTIKEIYENGKPGMILAKYEPTVCDESIDIPDIANDPLSDGGIAEKPHDFLKNNGGLGGSIVCDL